MIFVFYFFAAVLVFLSLKSFLGGIDYLSFFKKELAKPKRDFTPFVSVIAPCKGLDDGLEENLSALFRQDFSDFEILFVVDDKKDQAVKIIERVSRQGVNTAKLIVAGKATESAQKVHNLCEAVLHASDKSEIFVFVDSDTRTGKDWLKNLVAPLRDEKIGAATGYRWFVSKRGSFASEMRSVWNASVASALGANLKSNFCWGGSTAIRRKTFERLNMRKRWRGTLSDDFTVTRAMKRANLPIYFVPQALTASVDDCTFQELLEFTTRQMKITRVYAPNLWLQSFIGSILFNLVFVWGILILVFYKITDFSFWFALVSLILVSAFSIGKAHLRLKAVELILKDYAGELRNQFRTQNTLWILSPALFLYNSFAALLSRKIVWRGIEYELISAEQTAVIPAKQI